MSAECSKCGSSFGTHASWCPVYHRQVERAMGFDVPAEPPPLPPTDEQIRAALSPVQPSPVPNSLPAVWPAVIADMQARDAVGRERYGVPLQPCNGRNALRDMYEEHLDGLAYSKQALIEQEMLRDALDAALYAAESECASRTAELLRAALTLVPAGRKP